MSPIVSISKTRQLVLRYGWHATVYQILNKGISHWHAPGDDAVVGYVRRHRLVIAAGAPVCPESSLNEVTAGFENWARQSGRRVCYFAAEARLRGMFAESPDHAAIAIGAQPVWDPQSWAKTIARRPSLLQQIRRARNKQVVVNPVSPDLARNDPQIRSCLAQWLQSKPLPPMHFLVEPETLDGVMQDRLVFVAQRDDRTIAFLVASPVPGRKGYLVEQVARRPNAPNGTAELLIDFAMRDMARRGCHYATLGLVALAGHAGSEIAKNPLWLRAMMAWARAHGRRFYNFAGLEAFRAKMNPDRWDTVYAISNERRFSPSTLHAIAAAFCDGSPEVAVLKALGKAMKKEVAMTSRRIYTAFAHERWAAK
jgi:phosphatidylglycerol lysyltransferase